MKPILHRLLLALFLFGLLVRAPAQLGPPKLAVAYGSNPAAGNYTVLDGIRLYYETYGDGPVMLQIHGNGGSIRDMGNQIQFFSAHYRVIAADSRGHGKSEIGTGHLTYEQQAEDLNALLDELQIKSAYVLGWSDGGIIGLLLAIHHPDKVAKLAVMGANLAPEGAYEWAVAWVARQEKFVDEQIAKGAKTTGVPWFVLKQHLDLLGSQPHIPVTDLNQITAPTLVMAGDKDVIRDDHTLTIFHNIPQAHLAIFPGATHMIAWENPDLFNQTIETFFSKPYTRPDTKNFFK